MTPYLRTSPGMKTFQNSAPARLSGERSRSLRGENLQSVRGKVCQAIKQRVTIGECRDHRRRDKCTLIYTGNFDAFKCLSPSKEQAAGSAYIPHSSLPVWVFGLDCRKLFESRLRHFKQFCLTIQLVYSADAPFLLLNWLYFLFIYLNFY